MIALITDVQILGEMDSEICALSLQGYAGKVGIAEGTRDLKGKIWDCNAIYKLWERHYNTINHWLVWTEKGWWILAWETEIKYDQQGRLMWKETHD